MAIATLFDGIEYRSRLEARWAAFFNNIGWKYTYEPFDGDGYIPDFLIHGDRPLLVEVKPAVTESEYRAPIDKVSAGLRGHWHHDVMIVGASPRPGLSSAYWSGYETFGLLGEWAPDWTFSTSAEGVDGSWVFDVAHWAVCRVCEQFGVFHPIQSFVSRPCNHYDGGGNLWPMPPSLLDGAWAKACNDVKWRGRDAA